MCKLLSISGPPYFLNFSPSPISISQGQQKYVSCVVGGDPIPTTAWSRLNGTLPVNAFYDFAGLYITAEEGIDVSGVYVCSATNVNGAVEKHFEVQYVSSNTEVPTASTTAPPDSLGIYMHAHTHSTCILCLKLVFYLQQRATSL